MKEISLRKLSDEQAILLYRKCITPEHFDFIQAGLAAGELHERGYEVIEDQDEPDRFVKKEQKVA